MSLLKVNEVYYYRSRIPVDLKKWFDDQEYFKRSLKTKNLSQAKRLLKLWDWKTEEVFSLLRSGMLTKVQIETLINNYKKQALEDAEEDRATPKPFSHNPYEQAEVLERLESDYREALALNDLHIIKNQTDQLIEDNGLGEVSPEERAAISRELLKTSIEICQIEKERTFGNYQNDYDKALAATPTPSIQSTNNLASPSVVSPLLSEMIQKHLDDLRRKEAANEVTMMGYTSMLEMFLRIVGDVPVNTISRDTLRSYMDTLKKLPPNLNKMPKFRGKSISQILKLNEGGKTIANHTITKSLTVVKTFLAWMFAEGATEKNHSDVLKPPKTEIKPSEERDCFSNDDLQRMMEGFKKEQKKLQKHPERYWLPLIGMFSGMRLGEIAQLHIDDVVQENGIWCFKVQPSEDKSVKTVASRRTVPIHKSLIELGLIEHIKEVKKQNQPRLWMNLTQDSRGRWYRNFANWFLKSNLGEGFLRMYVTKDDKQDFHSFRHTVLNTLKQLEVNETMIAEIAGHSNSSITTGRYGKSYDVSKLKDVIDLIQYEGVELFKLS